MKHFFGILAILFAAAMTHAQYAGSNNVPAYHPLAPAAGSKLPAILTEKQLAESGLIAPAQKESYKAAARAQSVLYQMPCYCYCDRAHGHTSLRSCFESVHGANCGTCMSEALYSYRQSKRGWTPKMIREGIFHGDFKMIDLENVPPIQ